METGNEKNGAAKVGRMIALERAQKWKATAMLAGYVLFVLWCAYAMYVIDTGGLWLGALSYFVQFVLWLRFFW